ncbi:hypothetical protein P9112_012084 [Eukaryota sp. TZLM1-RC]
MAQCESHPISHNRRFFLELSKGTVASLIASVVDYLVYLLIYFVFDAVRWAAIIGFICGALVHFCLCFRFVFQEDTETTVISKLLLYTSVSFSTLVIHSNLVVFYVALVGPFVAWPLCRSFLFLTFTFPLYKYVVFGRFGLFLEGFVVSCFTRSSKSKPPGDDHSHFPADL